MSLEPLRGALARWTPSAGRAAEPLHAIAAAWPAIVGSDVAANSAPLSLANGTLTLATPSSAWSQQLQFLSRTILAGVAEHAAGAGVVRLAFRAGTFAPSERRASGATTKNARARRRGDPAAYEPAADLADALERVRLRIRAARRQSEATCQTCDAPLGHGSDGGACAPCRIAAGSRRTLELERMLFAAPWLQFEALRETLPRLTVTQYERSRRRLLARWWVVLERARGAERLGNGAVERAIAGSYVLLHSRLSPDRITPAIVRNLLGAELEARLFGDRTPDVHP